MDASADAGPGAEAVPEPAAPAPTPAPAKPRPVVAVRGDDRPGAKKTEPAQGMRGKFDSRRGPGAGGRPGDMRGGDRFGMRGDRRDDDREDRGPRLGDAAFRAQRDAVEHAQAALRKLAAQAHGEALGQLMAAWEQRKGDQLPSLQELGRGVAPAQRTGWAQALSAAPSGDPAEALLRLEIAADVPTPAEHMSARRMLQLQLLTKRNAPQPAETWAEDLARVFAGAYDAQAARRVQNALKVLLRRG
jgi:ATP-dependent RNA helicase SUPV3L1/SUV3